MKEHPDIREKVGNNNRHSYQAPNGPPPGHAGGSTSDNRNSHTTHTKAKPRGFLGKIKDKAIGTKEEREAERQRNALVSHPITTLVGKFLTSIRSLASGAKAPTDGS